MRFTSGPLHRRVVRSLLVQSGSLIWYEAWQPYLTKLTPRSCSSSNYAASDGWLMIGGATKNFSGGVSKITSYNLICGFHRDVQASLQASQWVDTKQKHSLTHEELSEQNAHVSTVANDDKLESKMKKKKPKGKRAMIKWLKFFRWKKKKEYERMTQEEKILYKLKKAQRKEERLVNALEKIKPPSPPTESTHDPEILTPEEHFYFLKMGVKCKNYVPVGRRGIFQGVILNMHLHWKKHETLKVIVKTFTPEEVKEIAAELAQLSGGIVLDIQEGNTIIMYRGKNYSQPPPEIMSPRVSLSRKKALDKSKYRDALRAARIFIPRLERQLEALQASACNSKNEKDENKSNNVETCSYVDEFHDDAVKFSEPELSSNIYDPSRRGPVTEFNGEISEPESLSDIFETDSDVETVSKGGNTLYLDAIDAMPVEVNDNSSEDFGEYLRQFSYNSKVGKGSDEVEKLEFDDIDRLFMRSASLLKKKRK
ncbi:uncharacterized CRM domain-containing protein At3g25440, chloroplastic [Nymphaea colorata]|nr:uncharacterized CRM domain-containing protein At3g25440, chloroplastic [Nymphaea colorata]XP_031505472.1 uncharacterized CRM domain-containing protein At3g25440, chloroplastic [Nymphaea colorata]